jgi:4-hydroxy-tetrahydrodipicolinate synthase
MFNGVYTALITPFRDGEIDYAALERIIEEQISAGIDGLVPMGTTGSRRRCLTKSILM